MFSLGFSVIHKEHVDQPKKITAAASRVRGSTHPQPSECHVGQHCVWLFGLVFYLVAAYSHPRTLRLSYK